MNTSEDSLKKEYHEARVALHNFLEDCEDPSYSEKTPSLLLFFATITFVITSELAIVFYFLGEHLGTTSALYASLTAIIFIFCSSIGTAFSHANTSPNLPLWRRVLGWCGILIFISVFFYGIGILSGWRADTVTLGFQVVIDGYNAMSNLPIFVTALVNLLGFGLLAYEFRIHFWAKYWGYRRIRKRLDDAAEQLSNEK